MRYNKLVIKSLYMSLEHYVCKTYLFFFSTFNLLATSRKKGKFGKKLPVRIIKQSAYGYYLVKLFCDFKNKNLNLKFGNEYVVDSILLKKISSNTWDAIVSQNSS